MIQKKVCLLGAFGVGKTSLVRRFVSGRFSDRYLTTVGVKIDRRNLEVDGRAVRLLVWDIHGEEAFRKIPAAYLRGASGLLVVVDGTRAGTVDVAEGILARADATIGRVPRVFLANKHDLHDDWELSEDGMAALAGGDAWMTSSARTGEHVEDAFRMLAEAMLA